jgi:hypothetical protein
MSQIFVLDTQKQPCDPVHPGYAGVLLTTGRAAVFRRYPFTIILKRVVTAPTPSLLRLKIDPGSRTTGLALVNDRTRTNVWSAELYRRGTQVKTAITAEEHEALVAALAGITDLNTQVYLQVLAAQCAPVPGATGSQTA